MNRSWARLILPTLLLVGGVAWCAQARRAPVAVGPTPPSSGSTEAMRDMNLLTGLRPGDTIDEFTVERMSLAASATGKPRLAIDLTRKGSGMTVWIMRPGGDEKPPIHTQHYAIAYGHPRIYGEPLPEGSFEKLGAKIAERVRANEAAVPSLQGL